jgi:hypothetical protein
VVTDLEQTLADGQAAWLAIATDRCRITKPGVGKGPFNQATGKYDTPARVTVYEGPCRIQVKADINSNVVETTAGEREWTYLTAQLQVPVRTPEGDDVVGSVNDIDVDHVCEILTAPHSPTLVGTLHNLQGTYHKSQAVYSRYRLREVVA